jgi:hypothetical protein
MDTSLRARGRGEGESGFGDLERPLSDILVVGLLQCLAVEG